MQHLSIDEWQVYLSESTPTKNENGSQTVKKTKLHAMSNELAQAWEHRIGTGSNSFFLFISMCTERHLLASLRTMPLRGCPVSPDGLEFWSVVTNLTVHSFSLAWSGNGLAKGEHIGLPVDDAAGEAGMDDTGVGRGVGSFKLRTSVSVSGNCLSGHGTTVGQLSASEFLSVHSADDDPRGRLWDSEKERWSFSTGDNMLGVPPAVGVTDRVEAGVPGGVALCGSGTVDGEDGSGVLNSLLCRCVLFLFFFTRPKNRFRSWTSQIAWRMLNTSSDKSSVSTLF